MLFFNVNLLFTNETVFIFLLALLFIFYQHLNSLILNFSIFYVSSGSSDEGSPKPLPRSSSLGDRDRPMTSRQAMGIFDEDDRPMTSRQALGNDTGRPITSREALGYDSNDPSVLEKILKRSHDGDSGFIPSKLSRIIDSDKGKFTIFRTDSFSSKRSRLDSDTSHYVDVTVPSKRIRLESEFSNTVDTPFSSKRTRLESGTDFGGAPMDIDIPSSKRPRLDSGADLGVTSNLSPSTQVSSGSSSPLRALTSSAVGRDDVFANSSERSDTSSVDDDSALTPYIRYLVGSNNYAIRLPRQDLYRSYIEAARSLRDVNVDPLVVFRHLSHGAALIRFLTPSHFAVSGIPYFFVYPYTHSFIIYHIALNPYNALRPYVLRLVTNHYLIPHDSYRLAFDYSFLVPLVEANLDNDPFSGRDESTLLTFLFEFIPLDMSSIQILHIVFNNFGSF